MAPTRRRQYPPVSIVELNIRLAWQHIARQQGLQPVAAWWRWRVLQEGHACYWLKESWTKER